MCISATVSRARCVIPRGAADFQARALRGPQVVSFVPGDVALVPDGMRPAQAGRVTQKPTSIEIPIGREKVAADLVVPFGARGVVIFAHGSGSGRHSPRNQHVAAVLQAAGFATLLADLLTPREADADEFSGQYRFDIPRLGSRVVTFIGWARTHGQLASLPIGLFGASTGAAAALLAAVARPADVAAVVSRGGRPDLAAEALPRVKAPTLLIVGGFDDEVIALNREAMAAMT
jgi:dienelactone hydrolase